MPFTDTALLCEGYNQFSSIQEKLWKIGENTGNILFFNGLHEILECEVVAGSDQERLNGFRNIVTTEFIWILEGAKPTINSEYWLNNLDSKLIPISVGLQAEEFKKDFLISPEMVKMLSAMQERSLIFARGQYTADVLSKYNIKNTVVVGCPSVYQISLFQNSLDFLFNSCDVKAATANFRTFVSPMHVQDDVLLQYIAANAAGFAEQTMLTLSDTNFRDKPYLSWFEDNSYLFFDLETWVRFSKRFDFSFGLRFHGNVVALLAGMRALFITIDSRTREMTDHFNFPTIEPASFDPALPLSHYFELADFSRFRSAFVQRNAEFISALNASGLSLRKSFADRVSSFRY